MDAAAGAVPHSSGGVGMISPDVATRGAAVLAMCAVAVNLMVAWAWFESLAFLFIGFYWLVLSVFLAVEALLWLAVLVNADPEVARAAAWGGVGLSVLNVNPLSALLSGLALVVLTVVHRRSAG